MADGSCRKATARVAAWLVAQGRPACRALTTLTAKLVSVCPNAPRASGPRNRSTPLRPPEPEWRWKGRRVILGDGSTHSMLDARQPKGISASGSQRPASAFGILRSMFLFCLATGAAPAPPSPRSRKEDRRKLTLALSILDTFKIGDVAACSTAISAGISMPPFRSSAASTSSAAVAINFATATFAKDSASARWTAHRHLAKAAATGMDGYCHLYVTSQDHEGSRTRRHREPKGIPHRRPHRCKRPLPTDTDVFHADDLAQLYRCRWHVRLDLRSLKITLHMDVLTCKTPEMVRKEIWTRLLAYNLIRGLMAQSAHELGASPRSELQGRSIAAPKKSPPACTRRGETLIQTPRGPLHQHQQQPASTTDPTASNPANANVAPKIIPI